MPPNSTIAQTVINQLQLKHERLVVAESMTGGLLAATLTEIAGSSTVFDGGWVAYSTAFKSHQLNIPDFVLADQGTMCEQTTIQMAESALAQMPSAHWAVAITGQASPPERVSLPLQPPAGSVWIAVARRGRAHIACQHHVLGGDRHTIRQQAVSLALQALLAEIVS